MTTVTSTRVALAGAAGTVTVQVDMVGQEMGAAAPSKWARITPSVLNRSDPSTVICWPADPWAGSSVDRVGIPVAGDEPEEGEVVGVDAGVVVLGVDDTGGVVVGGGVVEGCDTAADRDDVGDPFETSSATVVAASATTSAARAARATFRCHRRRAARACSEPAGAGGGSPGSCLPCPAAGGGAAASGRCVGAPAGDAAAAG